MASSITTGSLNFRSSGISAPRYTTAVGRVALTFALLAGAGLLGGYWFIRNLVLFENPFYPTPLNWWGTPLFSGSDMPTAQSSFRFDGMIENLEQLLTSKILDRESQFTADVNHISGWGWFFFVCGIPSIVVASILMKPARWLAAGFTASLLSLFTWVGADPWNMRFTLWMPALGAIAFALTVQRLGPSNVTRALLGLAAVCALLNFTGALTPGRLRPEHWANMMRLPVMERSTAALGRAIGPTYQWALQSVPVDETLGYSVHHNGWIYPLYGPGLDRRLQYIPLIESQAVADAMHAKSVRYLFVNQPDKIVSSLLEEGIATGRIRLVQEGLYESKP